MPSVTELRQFRERRRRETELRTERRRGEENSRHQSALQNAIKAHDRLIGVSGVGPVIWSCFSVVVSCLCFSFCFLEDSKMNFSNHDHNQSITGYNNEKDTTGPSVPPGFEGVFQTSSMEGNTCYRL